MVDVANYSALLPGKPFQELFSSLRAFGLESRSQRFKPLPYMHNVTAGEPQPVGTSSEIVNPQIDPDRVQSERFRNRFGEDNIDVKAVFGSSIHQDGGGRVLVFEETSLVLSEDKRDFDSSLNGGEGNHFFGGYISEGVSVIRDGSRSEVFYSAGFPFKSCCDSCYSFRSEVGCEVELFLEVVVAKVMKFEFACGSVFFSYLKGVVASIRKRPRSGFQRFSLFWGRVELASYGFGELYNLGLRGMHV